MTARDLIGPGQRDAQVWAQAFVETLAEHPDIASDEGTMIGWFANAMQAMTTPQPGDEGHPEGPPSDTLAVARRAAELVGCDLVPKPPDDDTRRLPIAEFRALGFVQEINRRLLHPAGLALEVTVDGEEAWLGGVWDYRDDPEGIYFAPGVIDPDRAAQVDALLDAKREPRERALGYVVQPVEDGAS